MPFYADFHTHTKKFHTEKIKHKGCKEKKKHCPVLWTSKTALFQKSSRELKSFAKPNTSFLDKSTEKQRKIKNRLILLYIYTDTVKTSLSDKLQVNKNRQKGEKFIFFHVVRLLGGLSLPDFGGVITVY